MNEPNPSRWASSPVSWAVVAAAIAAVIGLAGWETGYVVAAGAALVLLIAGVRRFIREQRAGQGAPAADQPVCVCGDPCPTPETHNWGCRCDRRQRVLSYLEAADRLRDLGEDTAAGCLGEWVDHLKQLPDASGQDPDPIRTDPDTAGEQGADQGGHDPDGLRIAADQSITRALAANPDIAAEYQRIRLMLHASRDVRTTLGRELDETKEQLRKAERAADLLADSHRRAERLETAARTVLDICGNQGSDVQDILRAALNSPAATDRSST